MCAGLYGEFFVINIAADLGAPFQPRVPAIDRSNHFAVDDDRLGIYVAHDGAVGANNKFLAGDITQDHTVESRVPIARDVSFDIEV